MADFSIKQCNPLLGRRLGISTENQLAPTPHLMTPDSVAPMATSLEVPPASTAAAPAMECPTPGADVPSTSSLPAAAAFLSALDDVDTSSGRKKVVRTNIGKKCT